jgi:cation diffusion facilitator family transporter
MTEISATHPHVFLPPGQEFNGRKTWAVMCLCGVTMMAQIVGGTVFGSLALVAGGLHILTQAGALLVGAMAHSYARRHATDMRFSFGTGKLGDLASFAGAVILAMVATLVGYEALTRLLDPVDIDVDIAQATPIAMVGLVVSVITAWLLRSGSDAEGETDTGVRRIETAWGALLLEVSGDGTKSRFRLRAKAQFGAEVALDWQRTFLETERPDGCRQLFRFVDHGAFLESVEDILEPHEFVSRLALSHDGRQEDYVVDFEASDIVDVPANLPMQKGRYLLSALGHVLTHGAVPALVLGSLMLADVLQWVWLDPLVSLVGAVAVACWSIGLIRDTGAILLDMSAKGPLASKIRDAVEINGDRLADLHLWRLGPGHLGAIVSVATDTPREDSYYRARLKRFDAVSHLTLEIRPH